MNTSDKKSPNTQTPYQEAVEHIGRAEQIVREKVGEKDGDYAEVEYVQMAAGVAYEGVLIAIDAYLERKEGLKYKKPQSIEEYRTRVTKQNKKLLPLLASCCGKSFKVNVFIPTNCSEFNVPNKKKCKALNQVGVSTVIIAKEAIHSPTNVVLMSKKRR